MQTLEERVTELEKKLLTATLRAEHVERQQAALLDVLGWSYEPVPLAPEQIRAMLADIDQVLGRSPTSLNLEELRRWARLLLRVTPAYLTLVSLELALETPWRPFLDLAHHLLTKAEIDHVASAPLVYGALDVARRNVQQAGHLWGLEQRGRLPGPPDVLDATLDGRLLELHTYLFPRLR